MPAVEPGRRRRPRGTATPRGDRRAARRVAARFALPAAAALLALTALGPTGALAAEPPADAVTGTTVAADTPVAADVTVALPGGAVALPGGAVALPTEAPLPPGPQLAGAAPDPLQPDGAPATGATPTPTTAAGTPSATATGTPSARPGGTPTRPTPTGRRTAYRQPAPTPTQSRPQQSGVEVTVGDLSVAETYWSEAGAVADLAVKVVNHSQTPQRVQVAYSLPASLRNAGTGDCAGTADSDTFRCPPRRLQPGASSLFQAQIRVTADAWRQLPVAGEASVTARPAEGTGESVDQVRDFAVIFPAGPPTTGMMFSADEVLLDPQAGATGALDIRLSNTGEADATGSVDTVLPAGIRVTTVPTGCQANAARVRCTLGSVPAGRSAAVRLPLAGSTEATGQLPLVGATYGTLTPADGTARKMQTSFRIALAGAESASAPPALRASPAVPVSVPDGGGATAGPDAGWTDRISAVTVVAVVAGVAVLALLLAVVSLRRPLRDRQTETGEPPVG